MEEENNIDNTIDSDSNLLSVDKMDVYSKYETGSDSGIEDLLMGEERDTIQHNLIRATSPKHRIFTGWDTRFPKRIYEAIPHGLGHFGRSRDRRMSDPGHLSVSPVRSSRGRVRPGLSDLSLEEENELEDSGVIDHPRLHEIRSSSESVDDCYLMPLRSLSPGRSRSRERYNMWKRKAQRSYSLPSSDLGGVFEVGEAIGALALSNPFEMEYCGRRRSVSMEPSYLEAIAEEGGAFRGNMKAVRRHSTTHI